MYVTSMCATSGGTQSWYINALKLSDGTDSQPAQPFAAKVSGSGGADWRRCLCRAGKWGVLVGLELEFARCRAIDREISGRNCLAIGKQYLLYAKSICDVEYLGLGPRDIGRGSVFKYLFGVADRAGSDRRQAR